MKNLLLILITASLWLPLTVTAYEVTEDLSVHGFISQGYVKSPQNPYGGEDALDGSFKIREAALNVHWTPSDRIKLSGQVINRQFLEAVDETTLDFLFADYTVLADNNKNFGIRLGRVKNQFGLYNASRDVPNARPGVTVPNGYFNSTRDLMLSTDGIELYGRQQFESGNLSYSAVAGQRDFDSDNIEEYVFQEALEPDYKASRNLGFDLRFDFNEIPGLKLGFSMIQFQTELGDQQSYESAATSFSTKLQDHIGENKISVINRNLFAQYATGNWLISAEYIRNTTDSENLFVYPINPATFAFETTEVEFDSVSVIDNYFLQVEYFADDFSLMARAEKMDFENPGTTTYLQTKGVTLGAKWFIDTNWTLATEISSVNGILWLPVYDGIDYVAMKDDWKVYQLQLTYQF